MSFVYDIHTWTIDCVNIIGRNNLTHMKIKIGGSVRFHSKIKYRLTSKHHHHAQLIKIYILSKWMYFVYFEFSSVTRILHTIDMYHLIIYTVGLWLRRLCQFKQISTMKSIYVMSNLVLWHEFPKLFVCNSSMICLFRIA